MGNMMIYFNERKMINYQMIALSIYVTFHWLLLVYIILSDFQLFRSFQQEEKHECMT